MTAFHADLSEMDEKGDKEMTDKNNSSATGVTQVDIDAAHTAGHAEGVTEGRSEGASAERSRIAAILGCDEAKGRKQLASHIAFNTDMSTDGAKGMLGAAPQEPSDATVDPLASAMKGVSNPQVGADKEKTEGDDLNAISALVRGYIGKNAA